VYSGKSVLSPGEATGKKELVARLLSPLSKEEVGSIRCIGLNVSVMSCFNRLPLLSKSLLPSVDNALYKLASYNNGYGYFIDHMMCLKNTS
jgi:hypothetical protein